MPRWQPRQPLTAAQRELAARNLGLAWNLAGRSELGRADFDEALSCAMWTLCRAAGAYDASLGYAESTYLADAVENELRSAWARRCRRPVPSPLTDLLAAPEAPDPLADADECRRLLGLARRHLSEIERAALEGCVMHDRTDREVAAELGVCRASAGDARHRAVRKLRKVAGA